MSGHDAASVGAALAGLGQRGAPLPPESLIEAYCQTPPGDLFAARCGTAQEFYRGLEDCP